MKPAAISEPTDVRQDAAAVGAGVVGAGAAVTAAIAAACCVGPALAPVFLGLLGAGGLAAVAGFRPYSPFLLALSGLMIGLSARTIFRKPICAVGDARAPLSLGTRIARTLLAFSTLIWIAALSYSIYGFLNE